MEFDTGMNLKATELRLGLPGTADEDTKPSVSSRNAKRDFRSCNDGEDQDTTGPPPKAQIVGWPPVRSYRKNNVQPKKADQADAPGTSYVKVSMDGAAYLRKIDLKLYKSYQELLKALEDMFKFSIGNYSENQGSEFVPTYEDKDGDWMLVGDVPWNMFISSCKRLRIMKGAEARGFTCL